MFEFSSIRVDPQKAIILTTKQGKKKQAAAGPKHHHAHSWQFKWCYSTILQHDLQKQKREDKNGRVIMR